MKAFIDTYYKVLDIDGDGLVSINEYRYNCITRFAIEDIKVVDDSFDKLLNVSTK